MSEPAFLSVMTIPTTEFDLLSCTKLLEILARSFDRFDEIFYCVRLKEYTAAAEVKHCLQVENMILFYLAAFERF